MSFPRNLTGWLWMYAISFHLVSEQERLHAANHTQNRAQSLYR